MRNIIGRNGNHVRDVEAESDIKISSIKMNDGRKDNGCIILGNQVQVAIAEKILDFIDNFLVSSIIDVIIMTVILTILEDWRFYHKLI